MLAVLVVLAAGAGLFVVLSGDDGSSPDDEAETAAETRAGDEPAADEGARAEGTDEADGGGPAGASADLPDAELTALIDSVMFDEGEIGMPYDPASSSEGLGDPTFKYCNVSDGPGEGHRLARSEQGWTDYQQRPVVSLTLEVVVYDGEEAVADFVDAFAAVPETCMGEGTTTAT